MPPMQHLLWPALGFAVALIAVLALRWAVMTVFNRWATGPGALAAFLQAIRLPSLLWCGVMAFYVTIEVASEADVLPRRLTGELTTILQASIILSVTITLAGMVETLITRVGESRAFGVPVTGLARAASRLTILAVGFLVLLSALGIHIAPILTALGVGGLAVALALQNTLSNLFAGMPLLADRPIRVGDYVKIADSVEGYVVDVGWRSTRVRMLQDNVVVVPNKRVAESIIINYDLPQSRLALGIRVSVDYGWKPCWWTRRRGRRRTCPGSWTIRGRSLGSSRGSASRRSTSPWSDRSMRSLTIPRSYTSLASSTCAACGPSASGCRSRHGPSSFAGRVVAQVMRGRSRTVASTASATSMRPANPIHGPR